VGLQLDPNDHCTIWLAFLRTYWITRLKRETDENGLSYSFPHGNCMQSPAPRFAKEFATQVMQAMQNQPEWE